MMLSPLHQDVVPFNHPLEPMDQDSAPFSHQHDSLETLEHGKIYDLPLRDTSSLPFDSSSNEEDGEEFGDICSSAPSDSELKISDLRQDTSTPPTPSYISPSASSLHIPERPTSSSFSKELEPKLNKIVETQTLNEDQDGFLNFIEPCPVYPPSYDTVPPGGCPKFAVLDMPLKNEVLPSYTPAVYKVGVVCRKLEWLSPYEPSPSRAWKPLVMELNSTQLNFYQVPSNLENTMLGYCHYRESEENNFRGTTKMENEQLQSLFTTDNDVQFHQFCARMGYLKNESKEQNDSEDDYLLTPPQSPKLSKNDKQKQLIRSYSLQHARIGLASDYLKRPNVLRVRLENEQLLLSFSSTRELVEWNLGLSVGRDVSMDLVDREVPRYRTVPRRRRNQINSNTPFFQDVVTRRNRAQSDPDGSIAGKNGRLKSKLSKFKNKLSSQGSLSNLKNLSTQKQAQQQQLQQVIQFRQMVMNSMANSYAADEITSTVPIRQELQQSLNRMDGVKSNSATFTFAGFEDEDGYSDDSCAPVVSHLKNRSHPSEDDGDDDLQNLSDLHRSDDDEEYDVDIEVDADDFLEGGESLSTVAHRRRNTHASYVSGDHKWTPSHRVESPRKFIRNCIKCIKPMVFDDPWVNKLLMKATTISPLNLSYIRRIYCDTDISSRASSLTSLLSMGFGTSVDIFSSPKLSLRRKSSSKEFMFYLPDSSLARITNHNLKEYIVGSHSLIPKGI